MARRHGVLYAYPGHWNDVHRFYPWLKLVFLHSIVTQRSLLISRVRSRMLIPKPSATVGFLFARSVDIDDLRNQGKHRFSSSMVVGRLLGRPRLVAGDAIIS